MAFYLPAPKQTALKAQPRVSESHLTAPNTLASERALRGCHDMIGFYCVIHFKLQDGVGLNLADKASTLGLLPTGRAVFHCQTWISPNTCAFMFSVPQPSACSKWKTHCAPHAFGFYPFSLQLFFFFFSCPSINNSFSHCFSFFFFVCHDL